jgi:regulation of enolase protein 1 (concanavalin A-like superfamily)
VSGAGADIWGSADAFHYVYQSLTGDGRVEARVASIQFVAAWTKVGVMIRANLDPGSAQGIMLVSAGKGTAFQRRAQAGGLSVSTAGPPTTAPYWVRVERAGSTVSASVSPDGVTWSLVGSETLALPATAFVGLAVSSHTISSAATATLDHVTVTAAQPPAAPEPPPPPPPPPVTTIPTGWTHADIGAVGIAGDATFDAATGAFTIAGAGADVWGNADAFHYTWRTWSGDGTIVARVASVQNVAAWVKAGVMIRGSTDPSAPHAFMLVSAGKGLAFQRRPADGGLSLSTSGGAGVAPYWVRLQRTADVVTGAVSTDGVSWTSVGSQALAMGPDVLVGLAVSSHTTSAAATAVFDRVVIR